MFTDLFSSVGAVKSVEGGDDIGESSGPDVFELIGECRVTEFVLVIEGACGVVRGEARRGMV